MILSAVVVPAVLRVLAEQLSLQREDVVEHAIDPATLQTMVGDDAGQVEVASQPEPKRTVDPRLAAHLGLFEELKAAVQRQLPRPVRPNVHSVPRTSTRPASVTRAWTLLRAGSE